MTEQSGTETREGSKTGLGSILSQGSLVSMGKFVSLGLGFVTQVVMARLLTEAAYGQVVLAISVVNIAGLVAKLGMDDGVMRELPHREDNPREAKGIVRASLILSLISGGIVAICLFVTAPIIAIEIFDDASLVLLLRVVSIGVPFIVLNSVSTSLARGARSARPQVYVNQLLQPISRVILISALVIAGFGTVGAVVGQLGAIILGGVLALIFAWRVLPTFDGTLSPMYRSLLTFSLPLVAVQGMGFLNNNIDIYMLGYFLESSAVGVYNIALQLGNILTAVMSSMAFLLPPVLARLHEQNQQKEMRRTYQGVTKWVVLLSIPPFTLLFFAPEFIIGTFFGRGYTDGVGALRIILLGKLFAISMGLGTQSLVGLGENRIVSLLVFIQAAVNAMLNYLLIPSIGLIGGALGMTTGLVVGNIISVTVLYRRYMIHPFASSVFQPLAVLSIIATISYTLLYLASFTTVGVVVIIGVTYPVVVVVTALDEEDEKLLTEFENGIGRNFPKARSLIRRYS